MAAINFPIMLINRENVEFISKSVFFSGVYAILFPKNKTVILTNKLEKFNTYPRGKVIVYDKKDFPKLLRTLLKKYKKIGFEGETISYNKLKRFKKMIGKKTFVDVSEYLITLRAIKQECEIKKIIKAGKIAGKMLTEIQKKVKIGMSEKEIWAILQKKAAENNSQTRFCIVQADSRTSNIHNRHGNKKLKNVLLVDIGPYFEDYGTDITRTIFFGQQNKLQQEVYNVVLRAQKAALAKVKSGAKATDVDKAAREVIAKAGYEKYFVHATGHGVGLEIHEAPSISEDSEDILKSGMVITIEPGIYLPGKFGVRIEDTVLVTKKGYKLLTHFKK